MLPAPALAEAVLPGAPGRLSRAAVFAFHATTAAATLGACGDDATPPPPTTIALPSTAIAQPYGAPPPPPTPLPPAPPPADPTTVPPDTTTPPATTAEHHHHHHEDVPTIDPRLFEAPSGPDQAPLPSGPGVGDLGGGAQGYGGAPDHDRRLQLGGGGE